MGEINRLPIRKWRQEYELNTFVETGVFKGNGVITALDAGFEKIVSIELNPAQCVVAAGMIEAHKTGQSRRWEIRLGDSAEVLPSLLDEDHFKLDTTRCLWWLDAHFPEMYAGGSEGERLPLLEEIRALACHRSYFARDFLVIDDWRIYEEIQNGAGPLPEKLRVEGKLPAPGHADQIRNYLAPTHHLDLILNDGGYMIGRPRR